MRISGPAALDVSAALLEHSPPLPPRHATFTRVTAASSSAIDHVVATYFPAPHSYTGEDVVEISAHGSPIILRAIVEGAIGAGARLAEPGEFTLRAYLNGKRDLIQAEAVADLIDASTPLQARTAFDQLEGTLTREIDAIDRELFDLLARLEASLDFPDEGYHFVEPAAVGSAVDAVLARIDELLKSARRGRLIREGATVVIVGRPNVGKSSVFNRLIGAERAIVTAVAGTTRDLVTERVDVEGIAVTLVDTAGARDTIDMVEQEGVKRAAQARDVADLLLVVLDASEAPCDEDQQLLQETAVRGRIVVSNKIDRGTRQAGLAVSAATGEGFETLRCAIARELADREPRRDGPALTNVRHIALLEQARAHLEAARAAGHAEASEEFVLSDLQQARARLDEVVGRRTSEDVLRHIFERFCIGK